MSISLSLRTRITLSASVSKPNIELVGRTLWADGISVVSPDQLESALTRGIPLASLAVTELTAEVRRLNQLTDTKVTTKDGLNDVFPPDWAIPAEYRAMDLNTFICDTLASRIKQDSLYEQRLGRLAQEIILFEQHGLNDVLRVLIYVVDQLKKHKVVWGVGRGSSCSSYLLYLLGLHAVDPVKYDIAITDFIR